jgi:hypothetical protein
MTVIRLRRNAPETQPSADCCLCGTHDREQVTDHVLVGTPGVPSYDGTVCDACGRVLEGAVAQFGAELTLQVEQGQPAPSQRDAPRAADR